MNTKKCNICSKIFFFQADFLLTGSGSGSANNVCGSSTSLVCSLFLPEEKKAVLWIQMQFNPDLYPVLYNFFYILIFLHPLLQSIKKMFVLILKKILQKILTYLGIND